MNNDLIKQAIALLQQAISEPETNPGPIVEPTPAPTEPPTKAPAVPPITSVEFENLGGAQKGIPFTFGQVFAVGHLQPGTGLHGRLDNGGLVFLQVDEKARHADGSVRHAIVSGILPTLFAGEKRKMALVPVSIPLPLPSLKKFVTARVAVSLGGVLYEAFNRADGDRVWMSGPVVTEFGWSTPLMNAKGEAHPHLHARFATRGYVGERVRVDVTVENDWAYEPGPQNFIYDLLVEVEGEKVFEQKGLNHYHHARWRKVFWSGEAPNIHVRHDPRYLIAARALPNYDPEVMPGEKDLVELAKRWAKVGTGLMDVGLAMKAMGTTGGRDDIGLQPGWAVVYLLSQDARAKEATFGTADLAGSWAIHYRDQKTDQPISLIDYPYMTIVGNVGDTYNPVTKAREGFPVFDRKANPVPHSHDISHQPNFSYLPYLLTGDHYHLEELQFWAMYNVFNSNPNYRERAKGLLKPEQVRGQAWALRTLAEAAYISPDADRLKAHFNQILDNNLDWYNAEYTNNVDANKLGIIANGYWIPYSNGTGIAPWMDDFFTAAVGHAAELGFEKARALLKWKAQFPISRMIGEGADPVFGALYEMKVRDTDKSPLYTTIAQAVKASVGPAQRQQAAGLKPGEMTGYSSSTAGYPSNMQPALAYAADVSEEGKRAWKLFMSRSVKPDYSTSPQFAIVPR